MSLYVYPPAFWLVERRHLRLCQLWIWASNWHRVETQLTFLIDEIITLKVTSKGRGWCCLTSRLCSQSRAPGTSPGEWRQHRLDHIPASWSLTMSMVRCSGSCAAAFQNHRATCNPGQLQGLWLSLLQVLLWSAHPPVS